MPLTANEDGTYTLTINGVETNVSGDDLLKMAQKGESADKRFQEAASIKKQVEELVGKHGTDIEIAQNLRKALQSNDQNAMLAAMTSLGMPEAEVKKYLEPVPAPKAANSGLSEADQARLKYFEEFTDAMRQAGIDPRQFAGGVAQDRKARGKELIAQKFQQFLENDPDMGKMMKKEDFRKDALRLGQSILSQKFVDGEAQNLDDNAISSSARDAAEMLKRILGNSGDSGGGISLGGTPTAPVVGITGKPAKPIERPAIYEDSTKREQWIEQDLLAKMQAALHPES